MSPRAHAAATSRRTQVDDLHVVRIDARGLQRDERMEVRRRHERHADLLALQRGDAGHARAVARDERLGIVDVVEHPEQRNVEPLRQAGRDRARPRLAELHGARRERADHVGAAVELAERDLVAGRLFDFTARLRVAPRHDHVLVRDHDFARFGVRRAERGKGGQRDDGAADEAETGHAALLRNAGIAAGEPTLRALRAAGANLSCEAIDAVSALLSTLDRIARPIGCRLPCAGAGNRRANEKARIAAGFFRLLGTAADGGVCDAQTTPAPCACRSA